MKVLVVNPNTSAEVTRLFVAEARLHAPADVIFEGVTGRFGAAIVSTAAEEVIAGHSALDLLANHGAGYDAAILAISFDTALAAARSVMPYPVVGITRAALDAARGFGGQVGLIIFGAVSRPLYAALLARYELASRIGAIEAIEVGGVAGYLDSPRRDRAIQEAALRLAARPQVTAIVICGAAIVGAARRLQPLVSVPLFDGCAPAVAAALADAAAGGPRPGAPVPMAESTGLSPALLALLAAEWPPDPQRRSEFS